jgi:hypothetical protein
MDEADTDSVAIPKSELIAISRLLWDIGSQDGTGHQHRVDFYHSGAILDGRAGLPPWPTDGEPTNAASDFYEGVRTHLDDVIGRLQRGESEQVAD